MTQAEAEAVVADARRRYDTDPVGALLDCVRQASLDRRGTVSILNAVVDYLAHDPRLSQTPELVTLKSRLSAIGTALREAEEGRSTPLLAIRRKGGRQALTDFERMLRGAIVVTLDLLEGTGLDRGTAAARIAKRLDSLGVKLRGGYRRDSRAGVAIIAKTILTWAGQIDTDHGNEFDDEYVRRSRTMTIACKADAEPETLRDELLARLERAVRQLQANLRK
ncbi:MAG: hypothetical protein WD673_13475 [Alphaproteobacteria bacterium]